MLDGRFYILISRKLSSEATDAELNELNASLDADPEKRKFLEFLLRPKEDNVAMNTKAAQAFALQQLKIHLHNEAHSGKKDSTDINPSNRGRGNNLRKTWLSIIVVVAFSLSAYFFRGYLFPLKLGEEVATLKGVKSKLQLPDGTTVWVNSDSKIRYANDFGKARRDVWLEGEAYFDVKHDSKHPFVVHTAKMDITDLGTVFNIKCYPDDSTTEATLIRGKIDVSLLTRKGEHITLSPNEKLSIYLERGQMKSRITKLNELISKPGNNMPDSEALLIPETAWVNNKMIFDDNTFEDIAKTLERRFDIDVEFQQSDLKGYHFTGTFEDEDLKQILNILKVTKPFDYELNGKTLIIKE